MRTILLVLTFSAASMSLYTPEARAQAGPHDICLEIDETRDTLPPQDRASAIRLLSAEFERAGWRVVVDRCPARYTLTHLALGGDVFVTLSGADGVREGRARGLDDLPALYSQFVRSIVTRRPMTGLNVVDRTNVTRAQASAERVDSDHYGYVRLGYGSLFAGRAHGGPSVGFGWRIEFDSFGLDVSFLNVQATDGSTSSGVASGASLVKLQGLRFLKPSANASTYLGGGLSLGAAAVEPGSAAYGANTYTSGWHGSGLQGELTVGYEFGRASTARIFVEGNAILPFYQLRSETYAASRSGSVTTTTVDHRYAPSLVVSLGIGWQRNR